MSMKDAGEVEPSPTTEESARNCHPENDTLVAEAAPFANGDTHAF